MHISRTLVFGYGGGRGPTAAVPVRAAVAGLKRCCRIEAYDLIRQTALVPPFSGGELPAAFPMVWIRLRRTREDRVQKLVASVNDSLQDI